jgi:flavin-binding protein dodecin
MAEGEIAMSNSLYKVIEVVGTSPNSWADAASHAIEGASEHLRDLRVGEVTKMDVTVKDGKIDTYRVRVQVSFKYEA